jgi:hypothetical protein
MAGRAARVLACCAALACLPVSAATHVGGHHETVVLSKADAAAVRDAACRAYGVATESLAAAQRWTYGGRFTPVIEVNARCAAHDVVNGLPSHYNVECRRDDDRRARAARSWQCLGWEEILVPTTIGDIAIEPGPYSHERATQTIRAALASTRFQREVHAALTSGCRLAANWSGQADEVAELSCASGHRFLFSFWCPNDDCPRLITTTTP